MAGETGNRRHTSAWPCDESLEEAARWVRSVRTAPTRRARARAAASPDGMAAVVRTMRELPKLPVTLPPTPAGREIRDWFQPGRRLPLDRAPIAFLDLPQTYEEYLRGRSKQALRTNLSRAATSGFSCAEVLCGRELRRITENIAARRGQRPDEVTHPSVEPAPHRSLRTAYDRAGDPVAISQTLIAGETAGLLLMVTAVDHDQAPLVRYALHADLVDDLIDRGVRRLLVGGSMLLTSPGTRYFQRRTGFQPAWLKIAEEPRRRR